VVDFYGFHVGKYTIPMDGKGFILFSLARKLANGVGNTQQDARSNLPESHQGHCLNDEYR